MAPAYSTPSSIDNIIIRENYIELGEIDTGKVVRCRMEKLIRYMVRKFQGIENGWVCALLATVCLNLHPRYPKFVLLPQEYCWMVKWKSCALYILSPRRILMLAKGLESRFNDLLKKYTFSPFVEVKKGDVVCDVGAYIGEFSLAIADKADKILAIEPDPIASACLRKNVSHLKNIKVYEKLLWKRNTTIEVKLAYDTADSSVLDVDSGICKGKVKMQARRLDDLLSDLNVDKIDFLKIDAEGAEPEVLEGAEGVLDKIAKIAVDCTAERFGKPTSSEVQEILASFGFQTLISDEHIVYAWKNQGTRPWR